MNLILLGAILVAGSTNVAAQTQTPETTPSQSTPGASTPILDTPIKTLMADPKTRGAVLKTLPKLDEQPSYPMFKEMTLKQIQSLSSGTITQAQLTKIENDAKADR